MYTNRFGGMAVRCGATWLPADGDGAGASTFALRASTFALRATVDETVDESVDNLRVACQP
jgi:hypothetical protein